MGLDISVYRNLTYLNPQPEDEDGYIDGYIHLYVHPHFKEQADELKTGFYDGEQVTSFRAGSYSGYNDWRQQLCQMALGIDPEEVWANPKKFEGEPFVSLINFADCEGTIGSETAARLLADFKAFNEQAKAYTIYTQEELDRMDKNTRMFLGTYFYDKYCEWMNACRIASDSGAISFH